MPEVIISATGPQNGLVVNADGSINTTFAGSIMIGSVSASVDSIYVQSGDNINITGMPRIGISGTDDIGSVVISSAPLIGVSGGIFDSGDITGSIVISSATKLGVSGIVEVSNRVAGSIVNMPSLEISDMGSPCFREGTAIASGTYTGVWVAGAGSRIEVHGWHVSSNLPGIVNIIGSAEPVDLISSYFLNYASGAVIEKTFCTPFIPRAADIPLGFQTTSAGSTAVTIYGKEVK